MPLPSPASPLPPWSRLVEDGPHPALEHAVLAVVTFEVENRKKIYNNLVEKLTLSLPALWFLCTRWDRAPGLTPGDGGDEEGLGLL